jgi:hypothetical protein
MTTPEQIKALAENTFERGMALIETERAALACGDESTARAAFARSFTLCRLSAVLHRACFNPEFLRLRTAKRWVEDERGCSGIVVEVLAALEEVAA